MADTVELGLLAGWGEEKNRLPPGVLFLLILVAGPTFWTGVPHVVLDPGLPQLLQVVVDLTICSGAAHAGHMLWLL